jgi:hypothetical protein
MPYSTSCTIARISSGIRYEDAMCRQSSSPSAAGREADARVG